MTLKDLIHDFLDMNDSQQTEGFYSFDSSEIEYLNDIPDYCYQRVHRNPSDDHKGIVNIIFLDQRTSDIFSPIKVASPTYVSRKYDNTSTYEAVLELAIEDPGQCIVLYGPSKLGKSALWRTIFGEESILVHCNSILTIKDIYLQILDLVGNPINSELIETVEDKDNASIEANFGIEKLGSNLKLKSEKGTTVKKEKKHKYSEKPINVQYICLLLKDKRLPIIFENYHRLSEETLKNLSIDLRTFSDEKINTIFVGIPRNQYELTEFNQELIGRIIFMKFNHWSEAELKKIALGGQNVLNVIFELKTLDFIARESVGSPALMQLFCFITCLASGVTTRQVFEYPVAITIDQFANAIEHYGSIYLDPCTKIWQNIIMLAESNKKRAPFFIEELLSFIKSTSFKLNTSYDEVFKKTTIGSARNIVKSINKDVQTADFLVIDESKNIYFGIPFLLVYIRWMLK